MPYGLRDDGTLTWFRREIIFRDSAASWQTEQYMIMVIVQIVRICADDAWLPGMTAHRVQRDPIARAGRMGTHRYRVGMRCDGNRH